MQLKGKIIVVIPPKSGTTEKGDWQSQQYVLETQEEHPKKLLFEVFGENKIKEFDIKQDEVLTVSFDPKVDVRTVTTMVRTAHLRCRETDFFFKGGWSSDCLPLLKVSFYT